jgi:hypothetical protein
MFIRVIMAAGIVILAGVDIAGFRIQKSCFLFYAPQIFLDYTDSYRLRRKHESTDLVKSNLWIRLFDGITKTCGIHKPHLSANFQV